MYALPFQEAVMLKPVTANQLRWAAEKADGTRETEFALVPDESAGITLVPLDDPRAKQGIVHVKTPLGGNGGLLGDAKVEVTYGDKPIDVFGADALFLTQSAVEKFVLPYYTRFKEPAEIQVLKDKLFDADVVIAAHVPPSETFGKKCVMRAYKAVKAGADLVREDVILEDVIEEAALVKPNKPLKAGVAAEKSPPGMAAHQPT